MPSESAFAVRAGISREPVGARTDMPADAPKAIIDPTPEERDLLVSLRKVIGERAAGNGQPPQETKVETKTGTTTTTSALWKFFFLLAMAVDLSLLYLYLNQILGLDQNSLVQFLYKLLPIVGGTLLVSYVDKVRDWLLGLTEKRWIGYICLGCMPVLLATQMHFYRVYVDIHPAMAELKILHKENDKEVEVPVDFTGEDHHFLKVNKPDAYKLAVGKGTYQVTPFQVLLGTLAWLHCPRISALNVEELHEVVFFSPVDEGHLEVLAKDSRAMQVARKASHLERSQSPPAGAAPDTYSWSKDFSDDESPPVYLPSGTYVFGLSVERCSNKLIWKDTVPERHAAKLDLPFNDNDKVPCTKK